MRSAIILFSIVFNSLAIAGELIPGYESSGNANLDSALYRLHQMYYASDCTSKNDSYEYVAPLITRALEESPELITDYVMPIPLRAPISEMHMQDLYEYQLAKVMAYEKVLEKRQNRTIEFSRLEQMDFALNDAIFRRKLPGENIYRDILDFTWRQREDGTVEREVRWVSNYQAMMKGEMNWLERKKVYVPWEISEQADGTIVVTVTDEKLNETLSLILEKKVVEEGKPAQWTLTDKAADVQFNDYLTGFCDSL